MTVHTVFVVGGTLPGGDERVRIEIEDGVIAAITAEASSSDRRPDQVIDADGGAILPGFVDTHAHVVEAGIERLRCDMSGAADAEATLRRIQEHSDRAGDTWIIGRGWELAHLPESVRSLALIDRLTGSRPAYLNNANGHCAWVNSAALAAAGIHAGTPDPAGGRIGRDRDGAPDGMLYESAMNLVADLLPPISEAQKQAGLEAAQRELHSYGVTAWHEAIVGDYLQTTDVRDVLRSAAERGVLRGWVNGSVWWPRGAGAEAIEQVRAHAAGFGDDPSFRCTSVKIMLDGTAASRTAAMVDGYADGGDGESFFTPRQLREIVHAADSAGLDVHVHANGDRAVRETVDAIAALPADGRRDRRHQIAHLNFVRDREIRRMAALGVIAVIQPSWAFRSAKIVQHVLPGLREQDRERIYRFGSLAAAGVRLASSSDWPVSEPDPWRGIAVATRRDSPQASEEPPLLPAEALSARQALAAATEGGAHALRREHEIGAVRAGLRADLVVADRGGADVMKDIGAARPVKTMIGGEVVFER